MLKRKASSCVIAILFIVVAAVLGSIVVFNIKDTNGAVNNNAICSGTNNLTGTCSGGPQVSWLEFAAFIIFSAVAAGMVGRLIGLKTKK